MKQIKVSETTNDQLDWLVAKCEGITGKMAMFSNALQQ